MGCGDRASRRPKHGGVVLQAAYELDVHVETLKGAKGAGATPWTGLGFLDRLWDRVFAGGGGVGLVKLGPKEARAQLIGLPLLAVPYFRHAFRGTMLAGLELFCQRAYVHEHGRDQPESTFTFRVSWV